MKREFKQRWPTIPLISTKQTTTSHLNHRPQKNLEKQGPSLGQAQK